ncbi:MAG: glycosyltransferase family 2 protein [Bacteroidota bacterium]
MKLTIIIVNYKTANLVLDCLKSLYQYDTHDFEIIVVDNFSLDFLEGKLNSLYPLVKFIQMGYNAGFARANNVGIEIAEGNAVLLLNSDTIIRNNAVNLCFKDFMQSEYVACGVQLLNEDESPQISGNYVMKGGLNYLLPLPYMGSILKSIADLMKLKKPSVSETKTVLEVDWINGAFLMVKKPAIEKAGMLDNDFFLYAEEAEWCSRLKKQGKLCLFGEYNVLHLQGESSKEAFNSAGKGYFNLFDRKGFQIMLSNFVRVRKEFGIGWFLIHLFFYLLTIPFFGVALIYNKLFRSSKKEYEFSQFLDFTKNVFNLLKFVWKIISNKPYFYKVL